ncbi:MAG: exodeoxyribonuclease VII small subunit [Anaerolineaceae bacterium]
MPLQKDVEKLSYEQAFQELQNIVNLLDEGQQPLEETLKLFERGQALARQCEQLLGQAQLKVQQVTGEAESDTGGKDA